MAGIARISARLQHKINLFQHKINFRAAGKMH